MEKPKAVELAVNLMWVSLVLGLAKWIMALKSAPAAAELPSSPVVFLATIATLALLINRLSAGRNWARITLAALFAGGLPFCVFLLLSRQHHVLPMDRAVLTIQTALQACALYLVFTKPGSNWFGKTS